MVENSKKIINWSLSNSDKLSLKVEYYTAMKNCFADIYDIGIFITIHSVEYYGRGTDKSEQIAYCKALSEAIERASLRIYNIQNTNGLALHPDLVEAKKNSKNELLERDAFFCTYLLNLGFKEIKSNNIGVLKFFLDKKITVKFYELCNYDNSVGVLCAINGEKYNLPFGYILGSSFDESLKSAIDKALTEAARSTLHLIHSQKVESITEEQFYKIENTYFSHHGKLALNLDFSYKVKNIFDKKNNCSITDIINESQFSYDILDPKLFPVPDLPLFIVKANNDFLQGIFTGSTKRECVNLERLSFFSPNISFLDINLLPHPFD